MNLTSLSGLWRLLRRLHIHYKRSRFYLHSNDIEYTEKLKTVKVSIARFIPKKVAVLFLDEHTLTNTPILHADYAKKGNFQKLAELPYLKKLTWRIAATIDAFSGRIVAVQGYKISVNKIIELYQKIVDIYHDFHTIYIIQDNWPVHYHPDIIEAISPQDCKQWLNTPISWRNVKPKNKYVKMKNLPIQLIPLPCYSPWLNPIEKFWKWLNQKIAYNHPHANDFQSLKQSLENTLLNLQKGHNPELLEYVGLNKQNGIYYLPKMMAINQTIVCDG